MRRTTTTLALAAVLALGSACGDSGSPSPDAGAKPPATTFTGQLVSGRDVATRDVMLSAGQAIRLKIKGATGMSPHLAILGDVNEFESRNNYGVDEVELPQLATAAGMPDGVRAAYNVVPDDMAQAPRRVLVGSADFYRADPGNAREAAPHGWLSFVAPQAGSYQVLVHDWNGGDSPGGSYELTLETTVVAAPTATAFDTGAAQVLTLDDYKAALTKHLGFLTDSEFFDGNYEVLEDCDEVAGSPGDPNPSQPACGQDKQSYGPR